MWNGPQISLRFCRHPLIKVISSLFVLTMYVNKWLQGFKRD